MILARYCNKEREAESAQWISSIKTITGFWAESNSNSFVTEANV
jgi:hypothetical protein